jgi:hypothetical protein
MTGDVAFPELGESGGFVPVWHPAWESKGVQALEVGVLWQPTFLINGDPALEAMLDPEVTKLPSFAYVVRIERADLLADREAACNRVMGGLLVEAGQMHAEAVGQTLESVRALLRTSVANRGFPIVS